MNPYWIKNEGLRLGIIPRPRGQDWLADDIGALRHAGVDVIVSALTPAETEEWGLRDESRCCEDNGLKFLSFPIEDRSVPTSLSEFDGLIDSVTEYLREGKAVVVLLGRGWTLLSDCGLCAHSERTFGRFRLSCG
jgi:hypothetical protein